jgi:WhiB family redox-sensing transcriptional regulator
MVATATGHAPWMSEGACRSEDPDLFFPISASGASATEIRRATAICHRCGVQPECLRYALINRVKHGIWGGRTEEERHAMTRTRQVRRTGPQRQR